MVGGLAYVVGSTGLRIIDVSNPAAPVQLGAFNTPDWALGVAVAFLIVAFVYPRVLWPLNWVWTRFGILLGRIVAPIVMGIIFFLVVTPIALIRRLMGKDSLNLEFDPEADSYWVVRKPPGPDPKSMPRQF